MTWLVVANPSLPSAWLTNSQWRNAVLVKKSVLCFEGALILTFFLFSLIFMWYLRVKISLLALSGT
jgi:hypothetical protein